MKWGELDKNTELAQHFLPPEFYFVAKTATNNSRTFQKLKKKKRCSESFFLVSTRPNSYNYDNHISNKVAWEILFASSNDEFWILRLVSKYH